MGRISEIQDFHIFFAFFLFLNFGPLVRPRGPWPPGVMLGATVGTLGNFPPQEMNENALFLCGLQAPN